MMPSAQLVCSLPRRLGAYELVRLLAHGGMAAIYLARHVEDDRLVALKILDRDRADEEAFALFIDEARVASMLRHPNLASVHELDHDDGKYFLSMEYVDGVDLREVLSTSVGTRTPVSYACAVSIVIAAAAGLDHAHRLCTPDGRPAALVHRDVSLSNIMIDHDGGVKVIDVGIATSTASVHTTRPGVVRGKAAYMAPEQCLGERVDRRTDVFALGIVLYELTTGRRCITGATDIERMLAIVRGDWTPPSAVIPSFPHALDHVIRTALTLDPAHRYASASALIEALEAVASLEGWALGTTQIAALMKSLFGATRGPAIVDEEVTSVAGTVNAIIDAPPPQRYACEYGRSAQHPDVTRVMMRRRLARGTGSDTTGCVQIDTHASTDDEWQDTAPTRGRRSIPRISWPALEAV